MKVIKKPAKIKEIVKPQIAGIVKKQGRNQKTGAQIIKIYETLKDSGVTPEDAIFYLMIHMDKLKANEIGMDMSDSNGRSKKVIVSILGDGPEVKVSKCTTPMVS